MLLPSCDTIVQPGVRIRTAGAADERYVLDRSNMHRNTQGFVPSIAIREWIRDGRVLVCELDGERAGYIATTGGVRKPLVVRHNTVERSLWSLGFGTLWMRGLLTWAAEFTPRGRVLVRTRRDVLPQEMINGRVGGRIVSVSDDIGADGVPVATWSIVANPAAMPAGVLLHARGQASVISGSRSTRCTDRAR